MIRTRGRQSATHLENGHRISLVKPEANNGYDETRSEENMNKASGQFLASDKVRFLPSSYFGTQSAAKVRENTLRDLAGRLIDIQEEERRRLARELHDDLSQEIALLSIHLEQLSKTIEGPESIKQCCLNLQDHVREISKNIYRLSYSLHPSKLEHFGLTAALNGLCQQFSVAGGLRVKFEQKGSVSDLPKDVTLCIFRIAQEALRNCSKHSKAKTACVSLSVVAKEVRLSIVDQGCGFDMSSEAMERGLGFTSMRERAMILGGRINIRSKAKSGTSVEITIPFLRRKNAGKVF